MNLRTHRIILALTGLCAAFFCHAQSVIIPAFIKLPKDSLIKTQLISSLNNFLAQKERPNKENPFVLKEDLLETSALLDEMKGMERNARLKDDRFYKCYLSDIVKQDDSSYIVRVSYVGIADNMPVYRATFRLIAKKREGIFYFSSPLRRSTVGWKAKKMGNVTYRYKDTLCLADARKYLETVNFYDQKLNIPRQSITFYFCDNLPEALQITGIDYKSDYNGSGGDNLSSHVNNDDLVVGGGKVYQYCFDVHDLWHERLRYVLNSDSINRPVDEGCAYLYGGSWGVSWPEVLSRFKRYAANNANADWHSLYTANARFEDDEKPMYVAYVINALMVQKIEKVKGFAPVMELLGCGKRENGDDNYFRVLEKITGITAANFNAEIWKMIRTP
jgi:hypothetical protein